MARVGSKGDCSYCKGLKSQLASGVGIVVRFQGTSHMLDENVECSNYLDSMIINDARCICEIQVCHGESSIQQEEAIFSHQHIGLKFKEEISKCYIWSKALCDAETWTLGKVSQTYLEIFELWSWKRMQKISSTDLVRNDEVYYA